jgi:hypothetical protein
MGTSKYVLILLLLSSGAALGQDADESKCVLLSATNGQTLTVRGKVDRNLHDMLLVLPNCKDVAVLSYAGAVDDLHGASSTTINLPRETPVDNGANLRLRRDHQFRLFQKYIDQTYKSTHTNVCIGCYKYEVEATFAGRLDVTKKAGITRDDQEHKIISMDGFGHPVPFTRYRFVVESVSDVKATKRSKAGNDSESCKAK